MTTYNVTIQSRRDTAADWTSNNPTLASGEFGIETDTGQMKVGDGATAWTSLNYFSTPAADASDTNTGTSTSLAVTPDALAGSYAGTKSVIVEAFSFSDGTDVATGDGAAYFVVPPDMDGMNLVGVYASHLTAGTGSGTTDTDIMIHNVTDSVDMLSAAASIREDELSTEAANGSNGTINASNDDVATADILRVDIDALVSGTAPVGLQVILEFRLP